jgi:spore maturation protein CgeB
MPSPQIFTGFQPRLFDIAAAKGFQIIDDREELHEYFTDDEIVIFKNIPDLKDKIRYYLDHPEKRKEKVEKLYKKVVNNFSWEKQIRKMLNIINA